MKIQIDRSTVEQAIAYIAETNKSSQFWLVPGSKLNQVVTSLRAALTAAPAEPVEANNDEVICPNCCTQFRAIPVNVQKLMLDAGFEPPFKAAPQPQREPLDAETVRLAKVALHEMPRPSTDWHGAAKQVCLDVVAHGIGVAK